MMLSFKDWLKENATTTACVASFARPIGVMLPKEKKEEKKKKKD